MTNILNEEIDYKLGWIDPQETDTSYYTNIDRNLVRKISKTNNEPKWFLERRLKALDKFKNQKIPIWLHSHLKSLDFSDLRFSGLQQSPVTNWNKLDNYKFKTFTNLGLPNAENTYLAGLISIYDTEVAYYNLTQKFKDKGIVFEPFSLALKNHESQIKKYFGKVIDDNDNIITSLNTALCTGGTYIHVPENTQIELPLEAYYRINADKLSQFERTIIVAEPGAEIHYLEGCSSSIRKDYSLHAAVVEIIANSGSKIRCTSLQNWSKNVLNLGCKRAHLEDNAEMIWVTVNLGSSRTINYPTCLLQGKNSVGEVYSVSYASSNQYHDTGAKMIHFGKNSKSRVIAKSISSKDGETTYRGKIEVHKGAKNAISSVTCDSLLLSKKSSTNTFPYLEINESSANVVHEATTGKIDKNTLFYIMSRGITEEEALSLIIMGYLDRVHRELPQMCSIEFQRLIDYEMKDAIG